MALMILILSGGQSGAREPRSPIPGAGTGTAGLLARVYEAGAGRLFWDGQDGAQKRETLLKVLDSAAYYGLEKLDYAGAALRQLSLRYESTQGQVAQLEADRGLSAAALSFLNDLQGGTESPSWLSYNELGRRDSGRSGQHLIDAFLNATASDDFNIAVKELEPPGPEYAALRFALRTAIETGNAPQQRSLTQSLEQYRWMFRFRYRRFILVNIPSAMLKFYDADTVRLNQRVIVGKTAHRTPRFAARCTGVVLYPYWNVPHSIAVNEILPAVKRNPSYLAATETEVLDARGRVVDPKTIRWSAVTRSNFRYRFREVTGCHNPLGVIKFEITDPFSVFIHDTNFPALFESRNRYLSHGCIRLENPERLADAMLPLPVDTGFLNACHRNQQPVVLQVPDPVPVFVLYMTAEAKPDGTVSFHKDVYGIIK